MKRCLETGQVTGEPSAYFDALTREVLARGSCLRFKARGQSMHPFIQSGDILLIEPREVAGLRMGDILFYRRPWGTYVVHRLVKKGKFSESLITKGDNLSYYDEPVPAEQVLGRVIQIEGRGRRVSLRGGLYPWLNRLLAWLARGHSPVQRRLKRYLGRLCWLMGGRRMT